jgi:uncharacterized membrane protein YbhN (UPF0104 family)
MEPIVPRSNEAAPSVSDSAGRRRRAQLALKIAALVIGVGMIVVLIQALRRDGPAALAAWRSARINWSWVTVAVTCALAGHAAYILGWRRLLTDIGVSASFWQLARMFLVSNLGRYLPGGKPWQMAIVAVMAGEQGLPAATIAASSLFQGVVGVGVGAIVLFLTGGALLGVSAWWLLPLVAGVAGLLALPTIVQTMPRVRAAMTRYVRDIDAVTVGTMWALVWTAAASWVLWGGALYALGAGLLSAPGGTLTAYVAAWTGSFLTGIIAIVSPAGVGAREGVMQVILAKSGMASADVLLVVVVQRIGATLLDIVPAVAVLIWRRVGYAPLRTRP